MKNFIRNLIALAILTFAATSFANILPSVIAEVSFVHYSPERINQGPGVYTVQLVEDGSLRVLQGEGHVLNAERLSDVDFQLLVGAVYKLAGIQLQVDVTSVICRMMPSLVNSDLYVLGMNNEREMVLSEQGCHRPITVYPIDEDLKEKAQELRKLLISAGRDLLE